MNTRVTAILEDALPELITVYQFGSADTAAMRPDSDLDLAFLSMHPENPVEVWELAQRIAQVVGRDVDLVDLRRASTVMAARVVSEGQQLLCIDAEQCAAFEAYTLSDYARLNEERRGILEDIRKRGRIHA